MWNKVTFTNSDNFEVVFYECNKYKYKASVYQVNVDFWIYSIINIDTFEVSKSGRFAYYEEEAKYEAERELFFLCEEEESNEQTRIYAAQLMSSLSHSKSKRI